MVSKKEIEVTYKNVVGDMKTKTITTTGNDITSVKKRYKSLGYHVIRVVYKKLTDA